MSLRRRLNLPATRFRILMEPTGQSGGGGATPTATPTATPAATPTATPSATPAPTPSTTPTATPAATPSATPTATPSTTPAATAPGTVILTTEQYNGFLESQRQATAAVAERERAEAATRQAKIDQATAAGNHAEALRLAREEATRSIETERNLRTAAEADRARFDADALNAAIDLALTTAISGRAFRDATMTGQATALLRAQLEAVRDANGKISVRQKGPGTAADAFLKAALDGPDYAHFQAPRSGGGSGSNGTDLTTTVNSSDVVKALFDNQKTVIAAGKGGDYVGLGRNR